MKTFTDKVAVITGAGSGIGRSLAQALYQQGAHLALCDIRQQSLEETRALLPQGSQRVSLHTVDVSNLEQMQALAVEVLAQHTHVDMLINNAGITLTSMPFEQISTADFHRIINVNMWGVYHGVQVFLPHLRTRPEASIVTVSSLAGWVGLYGYTPYAMSKAAVRGFLEALQMELADTPVSVLVVYPGGVKTNIILNAPNLADGLDEARQHANNQFMKLAMMSPDWVAQKILQAVRANRRHLILGIDARLVVAVRSLFPQRFIRFLGPVFKRAMLS